MRMNKVSMPRDPEGVFKVYCLTKYNDVNGKGKIKQICIHTEYWVSYEDARIVLDKLREYNPDLELRSTFTIND
jgi:hypothetical protein